MTPYDQVCLYGFTFVMVFVVFPAAMLFVSWYERRNP